MNENRKKLGYTWSFLRRRLVHLNLQILFQCNFRCRICDFWKEPYKDMEKMSLDAAETISEKCYRHFGPLIASIGGGEPLLHPDLPEIVESLAAYHFPVMICNGWYITPEKAKRLFEAGLYEVSISVDYADPEKHDAQRGVKGAFERAVAALEALQKNRTHPCQRVHMISVVMDDNLADIEPLIRLAGQIGVTYLVTLYSCGRGQKDVVKSQKDVSAHLLSLKRRYPAFVALRGYLSRFTEASAAANGIQPCYAGKNLFNIDCTGNVTRCIDSLDQVAGNILADDMGSIRRNLLEQHRANDCGGCWTSCRGNIESLMYGSRRIGNIMDSYRMTKDVALRGG